MTACEKEGKTSYSNKNSVRNPNLSGRDLRALVWVVKSEHKNAALTLAFLSAVMKILFKNKYIVKRRKTEDVEKYI